MFIFSNWLNLVSFAQPNLNNMKALYSISAILFTMSGFAQTITIPDSNFASYLEATVPNCMNGNELNIPCANSSGITQIVIGNQGLTDLTGVEHFTNLTHLICGMNEINSIPALPPNLQYFIAGFNQLTSLPSLPNSLLLLDCSHNQITQLPALPDGLNELMCFHNQLTALPVLPNSLTYIVAANNQISSLGTLPNQLNYFDISHNALTSLPQLPFTLEMLACNSNQLTALPDLPNLKTLQADTNDIKCFPVFPTTINLPILDFVFLTLSGNPFTCLPNHTLAMTQDLLAFPICAESPADDVHGCASSSGLFEEEIQDQLFPNPCLGSFSIKQDAWSQIEIYNALGQFVPFSSTQDQEFLKITLSEKIAGIYVVKISSSSSIKTLRMIVLD